MNDHSSQTADDARYRATTLIRRLIAEQGLTHWRKYLIAFILMAVAAGCTAFSAYLIGDVINQAYVNKNLSGIVLLGGMGTVLGPLVGAVVLSVVNELLWARFPEYYLAIVGMLILLAVLYMPRGIVNLAMKKGWLPAGRSMFRQLAREDHAATAPAPAVRDEVKKAQA